MKLWKVDFLKSVDKGFEKQNIKERQLQNGKKGGIIIF